MTWTAVVALKEAAHRKTRLAPSLSLRRRIRLSEAMARQVIAALNSSPPISRVLLLSPRPYAQFEADWVRDEGRGLNAELACVRAECHGPILVVHADLPLLSPDDIAALLWAAEAAGIAIAPDLHGEGTNAVALADARPFCFAFGPGSCRAHCVDAGCAIVRRPGLSFDIDTPSDLMSARAAGVLDRCLEPVV